MTGIALRSGNVEINYSFEDVLNAVKRYGTGYRKNALFVNGGRGWFRILVRLCRRQNKGAGKSLIDWNRIERMIDAGTAGEAFDMLRFCIRTVDFRRAKSL